jgi:hypothetical protein
VEKKKGRGSGVQRRVEEKTGNREGAWVRRGIARVVGISPRPVGAGSTVAVRQERATRRE